MILVQKGIQTIFPTSDELCMQKLKKWTSQRESTLVCCYLFWLETRVDNQNQKSTITTLIHIYTYNSIIRFHLFNFQCMVCTRFELSWIMILFWQIKHFIISGAVSIKYTQIFNKIKIKEYCLIKAKYTPVKCNVTTQILFMKTYLDSFCLIWQEKA